MKASTTYNDNALKKFHAFPPPHIQDACCVTTDCQLQKNSGLLGAHSKNTEANTLPITRIDGSLFKPSVGQSSTSNVLLLTDNGNTQFAQTPDIYDTKSKSNIKAVEKCTLSLNPCFGQLAQTADHQKRGKPHAIALIDSDYSDPLNIKSISFFLSGMLFMFYLLHML